RPAAPRIPPAAPRPPHPARRIPPAASRPPHPAWRRGGRPLPGRRWRPMVAAQSDPDPMHTAPPAPRRIGAVNWVGLWTLYLKEVRRFVKVATQTVLAPLITTLLFLAIFS